MVGIPHLVLRHLPFPCGPTDHSTTNWARCSYWCHYNWHSSLLFRYIPRRQTKMVYQIYRWVFYCIFPFFLIRSCLFIFSSLSLFFLQFFYSSFFCSFSILLYISYSFCSLVIFLKFLVLFFSFFIPSHSFCSMVMPSISD